MFDSLNDFVLSAIVFLTGALSCIMVARWLKLHLGLVATLIAWHTALASYYANYVLLNGGDAFVYFQRARFDFVEPALGTEFVVWFTSFPVSLGFTYWPISFLYNAIGTFGLVFFYAALRDTGVFSLESRLLRVIASLCLLIPSLSFWTSGIGKDSIAFMSAGLFLWAVMDIGRRQPGAIAAVLIMFFVRPHMSALMVLSVATGTMISAEVRATVRFSAAALAAAGAVFAVPIALSYSGTTQFASIAEYVADRQEHNLGGGSSIDIRGMNPVLRLLSFLYRPLPNEASGIDQLATSLDNLFLIALTLFGLVGLYRAGFVISIRRYSIPLIYGVVGLVILSQVTANLGLATRQKWMVLPALIIAVFGAWTLAREARSQRMGRAEFRAGPAQALR